MSQDRRFQMSLPQILAGALAAASAAFASSWLGLAGTVLGAVVVSVVASIATALYTHSLERSSQVIRGSLPLRPLGYGLASEAESFAADAEPTAVQAVAVLEQAPPIEDEPTQPQDPRPRLRRTRRPIHWGAVAMTSVVTLLLGFAILTGFESVLGSAATTGGGHRTTIVRIIKGGSSQSQGTGSDKPVVEEQTTPAQPTQSTSSTPEQSTTPTPTETTEPTTTQPTQTQPEATTTTSPTQSTAQSLQPTPTGSAPATSVPTEQSGPAAN